MEKGNLRPDAGRAVRKRDKTIDFRTSILYVSDEEDWLKKCCVVERQNRNRGYDPHAGAGTVRARGRAKTKLK